MESPNMKKKWFFSLMISSIISVFFLATSFNIGVISSMHTINQIFCVFPSQNHSTKTKLSQPETPPTLSTPRFAYSISGSKGELDKLWRTLHALYHPSNHYVVHLDLESPEEERMELASRLQKHPIFSSVGNVYMIVKANMVTYRGPTMVANTLHACAILLKKSKDWDWFINLSAADYPLVTQDDIIYAFSTLNRTLNFIEHTSRLGWKAEKRGMPIIVDPSLYSTRKQNLIWTHKDREIPTAFRLFTGSAWMVLTRSFVEYLVWGWDNLPRVLLMYYTNFVSSPEGYFHTVICNVPEFAQTAINHDLHYIAWDNPPKQHPHFLSVNDTQHMMESGAAFARKFSHNDPVLDVIDREWLGRSTDGFTPGGWCADGSKCSVIGDPNTIKPGPGADRIKRLIDRIVVMSRDGKYQCM